jgi:hypothetical protein
VITKYKAWKMNLEHGIEKHAPGTVKLFQHPSKLMVPSWNMYMSELFILIFTYNYQAMFSMFEFREDKYSFKLKINFIHKTRLSSTSSKTLRNFICI